MEQTKHFFNQLNFDFDKELKPIHIFFDNDTELNLKTHNNIFRYIPLNEKTQCTFTVVDIQNLNTDELFEVRKYIWNENKSDLLFLKNKTQFDLCYAFTDPLKQIVLIDSFTGEESDLTLLEKIGKDNFDTGLFWEVYKDVQDKIKQNRLTVDKSLVKTLRFLREKLQFEYETTIPNKELRDNIIQALIDRTLFIKFLEDKHIINSFFYYHFFKEETTYVELLKSNKYDLINDLFNIINKIFNNSLFESPRIPQNYLLESTLKLIADALERKDFETGQLSLFGYRFDIIPTEFIGHVYEMFFDESQSDNGIFYTPEGLAKLIVNETISNTGKILDPSCGSGMFLVVALRKLLENEQLLSSSKVEDIPKRNKILCNYIFGIEKQENARRLCILSLYLELLSGINPDELKEYIKNKISSDKDFKVFPYDFTSNIVHSNALEVQSINHINDFEYIIGNPPFLQIKEKEEEELFWKKHEDTVSNRQLSQCFFIKIKEWCNDKTKLGFVSNLSNFNSDSSIKFQNFFFTHYCISKFYNLTEVKSILFENANESTAVILFSNGYLENNELLFLTPHLTAFSKLFKIILLRDDDLVRIKQNDLKDEVVTLRDYFSGDLNDLMLADKIYNQCISFSEYLMPDAVSSTQFDINNGIQIFGKKSTPPDWKNYSKVSKKEFKKNYLNDFTKPVKDSNHNIPYLECSNIDSFQIKGKFLYFESNIEKYKKVFERVRVNEDYIGKRILFPRIGNQIRAVYIEKPTYYCFDIFSIRLKDDNNYFLILALLNSSLMNYYLTIKHRKRLSDSYPKITMNDILKLPIPIIYDETLINDISNLAKNLTYGHLSFEQHKNNLDDLIFDLYGLNNFEKQRVKDFSIKTQKVSVQNMNDYIYSFMEVVKHHLRPKIDIRISQYSDRKLKSSFIGVKFEFLSGNSQNINPETVVNYSLIKLLMEIGNKNIHTIKSKIYGENSLFIIRENELKNWSNSKAFTDAKEFLKDIIK